MQQTSSKMGRSSSHKVQSKKTAAATTNNHVNGLNHSLTSTTAVPHVTANGHLTPGKGATFEHRMTNGATRIVHVRGRGDPETTNSQLPSPTSPAPSIDEIARHYFPVTLGASYVLQATINDGPSPTRLSESALARGLAQPNSQPWMKVKGGERKPEVSGRARRDLHRSHSASRRPGSVQSSSSSNSVSSIERMHLMTVDMPIIAGAPVLVSSPFHQQLGQLRMERLRLEETHLLEVKRQEEVERMRDPLPKWYELRSQRFHYEAHKHNEQLSKQETLSDMLAYEQDVHRSLLQHQLSPHTANLASNLTF